MTQILVAVGRDVVVEVDEVGRVEIAAPPKPRGIFV
jgi:hypothetical protein